MKELLVSTIDNPYSPFDEFDSWYAFDEAAGYYTSGLLARVAVTSEELSDTDQSLAINYAVEEIVRENVLGIYIAVEREVPDPDVPPPEELTPV